MNIYGHKTLWTFSTHSKTFQKENYKNIRKTYMIFFVENIQF